MAWSNLIGTGFITGNDLRDAVNNGLFTLKPGQSIPANNTFLNSSYIMDLVDIKNINTGNGGRFPVKSEIIKNVTERIYNEIAVQIIYYEESRQIEVYLDSTYNVTSNVTINFYGTGYNSNYTEYYSASLFSGTNSSQSGSYGNSFYYYEQVNFYFSDYDPTADGTYYYGINFLG